MKLGYWARRAWHILGAVFPLALVLFPQTRIPLLIGIAIFFILVSVGEILRFAYPHINEWFTGFTRGAIKECEHSNPTATVYYLISSWACIYFFPAPVAAAALLDLSIGDPAASWVGSRWGKKKWGWGDQKKSLLGSGACFLVCILINMIILPGGAALAGALAATLVEALFSWKDDNLTVPLGAAVVMQVFYH